MGEAHVQSPARMAGAESILESYVATVLQVQLIEAALRKAKPGTSDRYQKLARTHQRQDPTDGRRVAGSVTAMPRVQQWRDYARQVRRTIEDRGFDVLDANIMFHANCPNIDAIVFAPGGASYVQIKSSTKPANANSVVIDGSPWTRE